MSGEVLGTMNLTTVRSVVLATYGSMSKNLISIDDKNFDRDVLHSETPFLLDFTATWCGPCKMLAPIVEAIANEHVGTLRVGKIDIDDSPETASRFGIRAAPTLILFRNGKEAARQVGVTKKERLLAMLQA
jgi:thioredoxin 1